MFTVMPSLETWPHERPVPYGLHMVVSLQFPLMKKKTLGCFGVAIKLLTSNSCLGTPLLPLGPI